MCVAGLDYHGASVLAFFGEQTALLVVCGGCTVSSGEGLLAECVGGIDRMVLWVGITRSVRSRLAGLVEVGLSVWSTWGIREGYVVPGGGGARPDALFLVSGVCVQLRVVLVFVCWTFAEGLSCV